MSRAVSCTSRRGQGTDIALSDDQGDAAVLGRYERRAQRRWTFEAGGCEAGGMAVQLDHMVLPVNDASASVSFYTEILGLTDEGVQPPFSVVRVTPDFTLQLAPWGTDGNWHLAFAMSRDEFDGAFARVHAAGIPFGDAFHDAANGRGPGDSDGARGPGKAIYLLDPNRHLVELRYYDED